MRKPLKLMTIAILCIGITSTYTSCKKYDEGPALSLKSKKARVANEWIIEYAFDIDDNQVVTSDYDGETLDIL
jgi:hypothetical protein